MPHTTPDSAYILDKITVPAAVLSGFSSVPLHGPVQDGLVQTSIGWAAGRFCALAEIEGSIRLNASGLTALPLLTESHVHLDKTRTITKTGFADGSLWGAIQLVSAHVQSCGYDDFVTRMTEATEEACARGVRVLRTHIDTFQLPDETPAWRAAQELRAAFSDRLTLQFATLSGIARAQEEGFDLHCQQVADADGIMGAFIASGSVDPDVLDGFLIGADRVGVDVDFHVDESLDRGICNTVALAQSIMRTGFTGRVVAGHCCALAMLPDDQRADAIAQIAASGMAVVSLPQTNLFLQDRIAGRTPQQRGITLLHELRAQGVPVAIATDNVGDAFFPFGDYDLLKLFTNHVAAAHLDNDIGGWLRAITDIPARAMSITDTGRIAPDQTADLMLVPKQDWPSILSTKPEHRQIIRNGIPDTNTAAHLPELTQNRAKS